MYSISTYPGSMRPAVWVSWCASWTPARYLASAKRKSLNARTSAAEKSGTRTLTTFKVVPTIVRGTTFSNTPKLKSHAGFSRVSGRMILALEPRFRYGENDLRVPDPSSCSRAPHNFYSEKGDRRRHHAHSCFFHRMYRPKGHFRQC